MEIIKEFPIQRRLTLNRSKTIISVVIVQSLNSVEWSNWHYKWPPFMNFAMIPSSRQFLIALKRLTIQSPFRLYEFQTMPRNKYGIEYFNNLVKVHSEDFNCWIHWTISYDFFSRRSLLLIIFFRLKCP